jgi:hypothetical protein
MEEMSHEKHQVVPLLPSKPKRTVPPPPKQWRQGTARRQEIEDVLVGYPKELKAYHFQLALKQPQQNLAKGATPHASPDTSRAIKPNAHTHMHPKRATENFFF